MKEYKPKRKVLPPNRAIEAVDKAGNGGTATWCIGSKGWFCFSASRHLRWMKGMTDIARAKLELQKRNFQWEWITPLFGKAIKPPFLP
jgi:hypothetical protein